MVSSEEPPTPEAEPSLDLYRIALDEYRFQVNLNWQRTQHWFTLNAAIAGAAVALLGLADDRGTYLLVTLVFLAGVFAAAVAIVATRTQHDYYRRTRDKKQRLEEDLRLGTYALTTTPGMRGEARAGVARIFHVTSLYTGLLGALAAVNAAGVVYALCAAFDRVWPWRWF